MELPESLILDHQSSENATKIKKEKRYDNMLNMLDNEFESNSIIYRCTKKSGIADDFCKDIYDTISELLKFIIYNKTECNSRFIYPFNAFTNAEDKIKEYYDHLDILSHQPSNKIREAIENDDNNFHNFIILYIISQLITDISNIGMYYLPFKHPTLNYFSKSYHCRLYFVIDNDNNAHIGIKQSSYGNDSSDDKYVPNGWIYRVNHNSEKCGKIDPSHPNRIAHEIENTKINIPQISDEEQDKMIKCLSNVSKHNPAYTYPNQNISGNGCETVNKRIFTPLKEEYKSYEFALNILIGCIKDINTNGCDVLSIQNEYSDKLRISQLEIELSKLKERYL
jgi:hypothetical protein